MDFNDVNRNSKRRLGSDVGDDKENDSSAQGRAEEINKTPTKKVTAPTAVTPSHAQPSSDAIFGISSASPPKFVSLEEIIKAAKGVKNMALAHEIAVDQNFKLEDTRVPASDNLKVRVDKMMRSAFFDLLRKRLEEEDPPNFDQALGVVDEIKEGLLSCLMPHNVRTRQEIETRLDRELLEQQARAGTLDLVPYLQYCVSTMAKLCSPARDEKIKEMTGMTDVPDLMKNILETLQSMRLDMANFTINAVRPHIQAQSVEYERKKFAEFLSACPDGLKNTTHWLRKHCDEVKASGSIPDLTNVAERKALIARIITAAFLDLLDWNPTDPYPETATLDAARFTRLGEMMDAVCLLGAVVLIAMNNAGPIPQGLPGFREKLKSKVKILLENESVESQELKERLAGVGEVVVKDLEDALEAHSPLAFSEDGGGAENRRRLVPAQAKAAIIAQITDVADSSNVVRKIVHQRLRTFMETVINSSTASPTRFPPGLTAVHEELKEMAATLLQLTVHNRRVFMSYYVDIIDAEFGVRPDGAAAADVGSAPRDDEPQPSSSSSASA